MRILIALNPAAGGKTALKKHDQIKKTATKLGLEPEFIISTHKGYIAQAIEQTALNNYDAIVAAGGDGTLFELVNGWMRNSSLNKPPVGILPIGTGNSFALDINLATNDIKTALEIIASNKVQRVDLGKYTTPEGSGYFANILGIGFVTDVIKTAQYIKALGNITYIVGVLHRMLLLKSHKLRITVNGETFEQDNLLVEVSNTKYTGKDFLMAPTPALPTANSTLPLPAE